MKKLLFSLSLLASAAALAGESSIATTTTFGVLPITTSMKTVIVSVPWTAATCTNDAEIAVSNLIKTANLTVGDTLRIWNPGSTNTGSFCVWTLTKGSDDVLYWQEGSTVTADGVVNGESAVTKTLKRGDALILTRAAEPSGSYTFYVYGQVSTSLGAGPFAITTGTAQAPAYTLLAPPFVGDADLNANATWTGITKGGIMGDLICYGDNLKAGQYAYAKKIGDNWKWVTSSTSATGGYVLAPAVSAGTGCWYLSRGKNSSVTVEWTASAGE